MLFVFCKVITSLVFSIAAHSLAIRQGGQIKPAKAATPRP